MRITCTMSDGQSHELDIINPDRVRFDMTRTKHGWPSATDAPFLMATFFAWSAMRRLGHYDGPWEDFSERDCVDLELDDEDAGATATP